MTSRIKPRRTLDPAHMARVRALPCICCEIDGFTQDSPTEAHHIKRDKNGDHYRTGQKADDTETIPLCARHHWNGVHSQFTHREFERIYGNERTLLESTLQTLALGETA